MKRAIVVLVALVAVAIIIAGCGGSSSVTPQTQSTAARIVSTTPSDGTTGVATDTVFSVTFSHPMNMNSVDSNFHIYQGTGVSGTPVMGVYSWNDTHTTMTFDPDQNFMSGASHTVHFGTGMMGESGGMMMNMSGSQMMTQDMYTYFMTQ